MNADLTKALEIVQKEFPKAELMENVVEFRQQELSTNDLKKIVKLADEEDEFFPWVFRSDKEVKIVFFIKNEKGGYFLVGENGESNSMLTSGDRVQLKFGGKGTVVELTSDTEINGMPFKKDQWIVEKDFNSTGEPYSCISNVAFIIEKQSKTSLEV